MNPEETMVENEQIDQAAADDAQQNDLAEQQDMSESLESVLTEGEAQTPAEESTETQPQGTSEPGWIKKRINQALTRQRAELEAAYDAKLEAALAPFKEQMVEQQARELVRTGAVKDLDTAKELVRYRQNAPQPQPTETGSQQPRNEKGQFAKQPQRDPATDAKLEMLAHQADRIREQRGLDVTAEFMNNPETKQKVLSGEWDFYDVADSMKQPAKKPPAPMRSPNGASGAAKSTIASMTDEQFEKLEKRLKEGARYNIR